MNIPMRNTSFVGRRALLRAVEEQLAALDTAAVLPNALHGLGGVGKSQLALKYILAALSSLASQLGAAAANTAVPAAREAQRSVTPYDDWLLVFDNAEDIEAVRGRFPHNGPGKVIVTSGNRGWERVASSLPVNVFERDESIELLQKRSPELSTEDADRLADVLGALALAVYQPSPEYTLPVSEGVVMTTPE
ncbi:putative NB-ARC domain-containing protein [Streptomyces viridochromogenes Tue57]|uniref:Putative NB-ARC domain-containing protein n=2 Tax=Streptomyces viridochromogenes TaxID=1938 RepID=L8PHL5_STRVR|nr:putative NB-ARC domain-containing protein [Streptomyces viridochromogenes Tue57]